MGASAKAQFLLTLIFHFMEKNKTTEVEQVQVHEIHKAKNAPFLIGLHEGKYVIAFGTAIVSAEKFDTKKDAQKYIDGKPWELFINTLIYISKNPL